MTTRRGLGKGLDDLGVGALLEQFTSGDPLVAAAPLSGASERLSQLPLSQLTAGVYQPREAFSEAALDALAASIAEQGVIQPLVVRPRGEQFEIIAGERRFRAAKKAGLSSVPCVVKAINDQAALAIGLIENIQREDLNAIEQAQGVQRLMEDFDLTQEQAAHHIGMSRTHVSNLVRLLKLPMAVQHSVRARKIQMGHARALLGLPEAQQLMVLRRVEEKQWSVRQTEAWVKWLQSPREAPVRPPLPEALLHTQKRLSAQWQSKIKIHQNHQGKGKMVIHFDDDD